MLVLNNVFHFIKYFKFLQGSLLDTKYISKAPYHKKYNRWHYITYNYYKSHKVLCTEREKNIMIISVQRIKGFFEILKFYYLMHI